MSLPIFKTELENSNIKSDKCPKSSDVEYVNGIPVYDKPNNDDDKLTKRNEQQPEGCYIIDYGSAQKDNAKNIYEKNCPKKNRTGIYYRDPNDNNLSGICHMENISSLQKSPVEKFIMYLIISLVFVILFSIIACCGEFWLKFGDGINCIKVVNTCLNIGKDSVNNKVSLIEQHFRFRISNYPYQKCNRASTNIEGGEKQNNAKVEIDHDEIEGENCIYQKQDVDNIDEKPFPYNIGEYAENNFDGELIRLLPRIITFAITCFIMSFRYVINKVTKKGCDMYDKVSKNKYMELLLFIFIPVIFIFVSGFTTLIPFIGVIVFILYLIISVIEILCLHSSFFYNENRILSTIGGFFIMAGLILSVYMPIGCYIFNLNCTKVYYTWFIIAGISAILMGGFVHQGLFKELTGKSGNKLKNQTGGNDDQQSGVDSDASEKVNQDQKIVDNFRKAFGLLLIIFEFDKLTDKQKEQYYNYRPEKLNFSTNSYKISGFTILNIIFVIISLIYLLYSSSNDSDYKLATEGIGWTWFSIIVLYIVLRLLKAWNPDNISFFTRSYPGYSDNEQVNADRRLPKLNEFWGVANMLYLKPQLDIGYSVFVFMKILYMMVHLLILFITLFFINPIFGISYIYIIFNLLFNYFITPIISSPRLFFELLKKKGVFLTLFFCVLVITSIQKSHVFASQTENIVGIMAAVFAILVLYNIYKSNKE